ncbi:pyridoxamine 5'-phosphate oxidase family protein [bacterium]|nr:MAG: pyridoxamine 5'-phosphate oxidase family protein [bacterium]
MIPDSLKNSLDGAIPSMIVSVDENDMPNVTIVSQVFYVDENHVAISNQFLSKTIRNLTATKRAAIQLIDPIEIFMWILQVEFIREEKEGSLFDDMNMQLEAIASMTGMQDVFKLKSAFVCRVHSVEKLPKA